MSADAAMDLARFEALAEAYGGDVAAWPEGVREAAALLMSGEPEATRILLERARGLDAVLDAWRPVAASAALRDRIVAVAPAPRRRLWAGWLSPAALAAGLAAACLAGVAVGVQVSQRTAAGDTAASSQIASSTTLNLEPSLDLEGA